MKLNFEVVESPWTYRLFWLISVAGFILPAWAGLLGAEQVDRWPGPIHGGLTYAHRTLFSIFYGMLGWICVRLVWYQFQDWWLRIWWIFIYGLVCIGFVQTVTSLLIHFGVMTG